MLTRINSIPPRSGTRSAMTDGADRRGGAGGGHYKRGTGKCNVQNASVQALRVREVTGRRAQMVEINK